ncbi:MAG: hypothetical protein HN658_09925 [Rhodospirillales bacterium]|jgi:hypothetical protein|nr:hypothetical protein [Rhodospirillales bacterium]MBT4006262.1 hypothetical protein [Rhodospirillales bacterium]MBT5075650.1 hypothetical protein [Rhodospirillales bacterium]MBT5112364.1 hypothetical protein [Rhodospirillales bacterium]MBT5672065.1 hypothetical protein [Rhodospirillales bacterium]
MKFYKQRLPIISEYERYPVPVKQIEPFTTAEAADAYAMLKDPDIQKKHGEPDKTYPGAVCYYNLPPMAPLAEKLKQHIRPFLDFDIVETYRYARLYGMGDKLDIHVDRGACFVSVSVCFGYDYNDFLKPGQAWALGALDRKADDSETEIIFNLQPGQGMLYPGCSAPHWRDVFLGQHCGQAFFHYVPTDDAVFEEFMEDTETKKKRLAEAGGEAKKN